MKKSLFSLMLVCLAFIGVAKAQDKTLTVYDGTVTNRNVPMYTYYFDDFTRSQFVIPATDLEAMTTGEISAITFYTSLTSAYTTVSEVDIYVAEVASSTISDFINTEDALVVYHGTVDFVLVGGYCQTTITFNAPYTYSGANLLIGCDNTTDAGYKSIYFYGQTVSGASVSGSNADNLANVTASQQNFIPKTTFTYTGGTTVTCFKPENLTASLTPGNGSIATLTWELNDEDPSEAWVLQYGTDATFADGSYTEVEVNTTTANLTGLTAETTYYARVRPTCDTEGTKWSSIATFTPSDVYALTVNDGTATNNYVPFYGLYADSDANSQFIIPASALTSLQWGTINKLTFYASTASASWSGAVYDVYFSEVNNTQFESAAFEDWTAMTNVYTGSVSVVDNKMELTLTTPYQYMGGNLLIGFDETTNSSNYPSPSWLGENQTVNTAVYQYSSNSANRSQFLPKITFDFTPGVAPSCITPSGVTVETFWTTANLSWTGSSNSYAVQYRSAAQDAPAEGSFYDDFEAGLDNWTLITLGEGSGWVQQNPALFDASYSAHSGEYVAMCRSWAGSSYSADDWMISPQITLPSNMSFWARGDASYPETYYVCVSTTGTDTENDFTVVATYTTNPSTWMQLTVDLSEYAGRDGYVAFHHVDYDKDYLWIDDVLVGEMETIPAGAWVELTTTDTSIELTGLTANTTYEYQVKGICDDSESDWTTVRTFTTLNETEKHFVTDGEWNEAANWMPEGVPTAESNVTIKAAVTIPNGCVAKAHNLTLGTGGSILIKDGGQLEFDFGENVEATVEKYIKGYTGNKDNYYLISSPFGYTSSTSVENLLTGNFDFYSFDGTQEDEWRNYETSTFDMKTGWGYLYANDNAEGVTLRFTGELKNPGLYYCGGNSSSYLTFDETADLGTFNLLGNIYPREGMLYYYDGSTTTPVTDYYVMNAAGTKVEPSTGNLAPMQGAFIQATESYQLALIGVAETSKSSSNPMLNMTITSANETVDKARIRFGEGHGLEKFQFGLSSKLYMPVDGKDYAVVYSEGMGEMPVNFKAEENGSYTFSISNEEVSFSYLHLIDNMTGADVDLLVNPSYSFNANTTDYSSRFKLVFATGNNNESSEFAFVSNGNIIVNGEGMLQVIDMTGRIVSSKQINGVSSINLNAAAGVYVLQLTNGNDVKTQKIVVK